MNRKLQKLSADTFQSQNSDKWRSQRLTITGCRPILSRHFNVYQIRIKFSIFCFMRSSNEAGYDCRMETHMPCTSPKCSTKMPESSPWRPGTRAERPRSQPTWLFKVTLHFYLFPLNLFLCITHINLHMSRTSKYGKNAIYCCKLPKV